MEHWAWGNDVDKNPKSTIQRLVVGFSWRVARLSLENRLMLIVVLLGSRRFIEYEL